MRLMARRVLFLCAPVVLFLFLINWTALLLATLARSGSLRHIPISWPGVLSLTILNDGCYFVH